jgi:hypothetical protein
MNAFDPGKDKLTYYLHDGSAAFRFRLAGHLTSDNARGLEQAWKTAAPLIGTRSLLIDLSHVMSADASGRRLLDQWYERGARFIVASTAGQERIASMTTHSVVVARSDCKTSALPSFRVIPGWLAKVCVSLFPGNAERRMQLADSSVRCEAGADRCFHELFSGLDSSRRGQDAHPADQGGESDEFRNLWLAAQEGITRYFRCRDDEILVEVVSPRHFAGELPGPRLRTLAQPGRDPRG